MMKLSITVPVPRINGRDRKEDISALKTREIEKGRVRRRRAML